MRSGAALAAVALLALTGSALATLGDNGLATYSGRKRESNTLVFGNEMVVDQAMAATIDFTKNVLKGTFKPVPNDPATEKEEVFVECLNSVAPPPLNWKMWCPGTDAKVMGWTDKSGAAHRQITLRPQAGVTSTMYQWFITSYVMGLMPPVVEFQGNNYWYYHLWHPLDHVESALSIGPAVPILQKGPPLYVLIHERYRNPQSLKADRHFETNGWFYVEDAVSNIMKNRYVITMPLMGMPTWTMILEFNDTPEGLVVDIEVVAGLPFKGYDERAATSGYFTAAGLNEMFTAPLLAKQKGSTDWVEAINAITRHCIEEFSNLQHFVPYLWEKHTPMGKAGLNWIPTLGTWMQYNKKSLNDGASVSFYKALAAAAAKQVNLSNTTHGALVDAAAAAANKGFEQATAAVTAVAEAKNQAFATPLSNAATEYALKTNAANGAHPKNATTLLSLTNKTSNPLNDALVQGMHAKLNATGRSWSITHGNSSAGNGTHGMMHSMGKGLGKLVNVTISSMG